MSSAHYFDLVVVIAICLLTGVSSQNENTADGVSLGAFTKTNHGVTGEVYVVDMHRLHIKNFNYDGLGPDAYFFAGAKSANVPAPTATYYGIKMADEYGRLDKEPGGSKEYRLRKYVDKSIILTLPDGMTVADVQFLTVWCEQASARFGEVIFPDSLTVPAAVDVGEITTKSNGVSGTVRIVDQRTLHIQNFNYDGSRSAVFWAGKGAIGPQNGFRIRDKYNRLLNTEAATNEDFMLVLPQGMTVMDMEYFSIYDTGTSSSLGDVQIPAGLDNVPIYTGSVGPYFGEYIGFMDGGVNGVVYVVDNKRVRVKLFNFDGQAPDTFFYVGVRDRAGSTAEAAHGGGVLVGYPDLTSSVEVLEAVENGDVIVTLPDGIMVWDITWFSVWCREVEVIMTSIKFPNSIYISMTENVGPLSNTANGISSGDVTLLNERTITIDNLILDASTYADAHFWIGSGNAPDASGMAIPNENMRMGALMSYSGDTVWLQLPEMYHINNYDYLAIWDNTNQQSLGYVMFPADDLHLAPFVSTTPLVFDNCEQMNPNFNVAWQIMDNRIYFEYTGGLSANNRYMGFGLSGNPSGLSMIGADVAIGHYAADMAVAEDYYLSSKAFCSSGNGVCPDSEQTFDGNAGTNDVHDVMGSRMDGVTTITFWRPLKALDTKDREILTNQDQAIIWAMGYVTAEGVPQKHELQSRQQSTRMINFGRSATRNCPAVEVQEVVVVTPWEIPMIEAVPPSTVFTTVIGPSGGNQGYTGITGSSSWGIAFYINGYLIPELMVKRGTEYTFVVEAGNNPNDDARFHPLYITDDASGGYGGKSQTDQDQETVYAGITNRNYTAAGRFCQYVETGAGPDTFDMFKNYKATLNMECEEGAPGMLRWTPDDNTPDVVYYQCYKHKFLGWKIHVVDEFPTQPTPSSCTCVDFSTVPTVNFSTAPTVNFSTAPTSSSVRVVYSLLFTLIVGFGKFLL